MPSSTDSLRPAHLIAQPKPFPVGPGAGRTTITWNTGADGVIAEIYVSADDAKETLFARGVKGAFEAPWISVRPADTRAPLTRTVVTRQVP
jgi:hypothetical protein